ncbi:hypothetical protein F966_03944 [Acinetobacter higginsii]|uniref:Uncharacterized protein n=1 Tax=Acinetobacter higginsii TaxID=70347 RepID=N8W7U5_9GAMM|nr:hypothetical protein [Acinetobacter higginsii]ENV08082.1 hypothetical protein F966_03944 [Acinetobacter higginsii]
MGNHNRGLKVQSAPDKPVTKIVTQDYIITVGFEVNHPDAFVSKKNGIVFKSDELTQLLDVDYGHAFFYVTKNDIVEVFFSFGPSGAGKDGWFGQGGMTRGAPNNWNYGAAVKDGYASSRSGTPDYAITEKTHLYRMFVSETFGKKIIESTNKVRKEILAGGQKYTAWVNDTCAETAYDILVDYISNLPKGSGPVYKSGAITLNVINPYMWHHNFTKSKFANPEIVYPRVGATGGLATLSSDNNFTLNESWVLKPKDKDPLANEGYIGKK